MTQTLHELNFDNRYARELPVDSLTENVSRQVKGACFTRVQPTPVAAPRLVAYSKEVAALLDLASAVCETPDFLKVFSGNRLLPGMDPFAMCYGGHQFGSWAGQLGDGRAINLGEVLNSKSERWVLQLKGAGRTPYSRTADGLAVLRSSIREFLCSEAMFHLGVPTTRALSVVLTGEKVTRDMFYDGNPQEEPGAIVCRVAPSFVRFGNFEIFAARGEHNVLRQLIEYTIRTDFPHLGEPTPETILRWYGEVCNLTALMVAHWMRVGFVHGVMNTDNMSILGLTIDYGPYGWVENYDPDWTPNTTDAQGRRYRFGTQAQVASWNLAQLGNAIGNFVPSIDALQNTYDGYTKTYQRISNDMTAQKLGLKNYQTETDDALVSELQQILSMVETDMTIFYRALANIKDNEKDDLLIEPITNAYYKLETVTPEIRKSTANWMRSYLKRLEEDGLSHEERRKKMNAANPKYVLRNYLAQEAIDLAEKGDFSKVNELLELLRKPYDEQPEKEAYAAKRPEWARHRAGCSMLSCSS